MTKKAIFGGTFDPIHLGHINIAHEALRNLNLDEIIFVPCGNPPHKQDKKITDAYLRYEMVLSAIRKSEMFSVSDFEICNPEISFTYITLDHFKKLEPKTQWYFITGADSLMEIENWKYPQRIFDLANLVVFGRPGYTEEQVKNKKLFLEEKYCGEITVLNSFLADISSTKIRELVKNNVEVESFMPQSVYNIMKELKLYN